MDRMAVHCCAPTKCKPQCVTTCPHFIATNSNTTIWLYTPLRGAAFSSNFREQLSGAALQNSFGEPFWGIGLKNRSFWAIVLDSSFGEQLLVATLGRSFRGPLCRMALGSRFGEQVAESQLWVNSFGEQLWGTTLGSSAGEQL